MASRSSSANRPAVAATPSAASTSARPASSTAAAIFARTRAAPAAAASTSHASAPGAEREERGPGRAGGLWCRRPRRPGRVLRVAGVVRELDPRPPGRGQGMAGDLDQPGRWRRRPQRAQRQRAQVGDYDQLIPRRADPHLRTHQPGWGGVAHRPEPHPLIGVDQPRLPERCGIRRRRKHVQAPALDQQPLDQQPLGRDRAGLPPPTGVHRRAEPVTHRDQRRHVRVGLAQVGLGRHEIGLRDPHRCLRTALGLRVEPHTRRDLDAVVAPGGDHLGMAHGNRATCSTVTVFSLSLRAYVRAPPRRRSDVSMQLSRVGRGAVPGRDDHPEP